MDHLVNQSFGKLAVNELIVSSLIFDLKQVFEGKVWNDLIPLGLVFCSLHPWDHPRGLRGAKPKRSASQVQDSRLGCRVWNAPSFRIKPLDVTGSWLEGPSWLPWARELSALDLSPEFSEPGVQATRNLPPLSLSPATSQGPHIWKRGE